MSTETTLSRWLREEMPRHGYSLDGPRAGGISRLAEDAGVPQATISRLVNGRAGAPEADTLRKIGKVFGYSLGQMLVFAGLAEADEVLSTQIDEETKRRLEAIKGGKRDPRDYTEDQFYRDVGDLELVPPYPPGGFQHDDERKIWEAEWTLPSPAFWEWGSKYGTILKLREKRNREEERRLREETEQRRESNGA